MTNIKKIGLTALAASLVSTSAFTADLKAKGNASITASGLSGNGVNQRTSYTMGDSLTISGSGDLENGLKVTVSFEIDGNENTSSSQFDDHSVKIASEAIGTFTFHGHGGKSATESIGSTVSGNIWDDYDGKGVNPGTDLLEGGASNNSFLYTTPDLVKGLTAFVSASPNGNSASNSSSTVNAKAAYGYGITYAGIEGLKASYADANVESTTASASGDQKVYKASYAFGPITVGYANSRYKTGSGTAKGVATSSTAADVGQTATSMSASYSINENMSVSYGTENLDSGAAGDEDAKYQRVSVAYTAGGMTISSEMSNADNIGHTADLDEDLKYWELGLAFNF